MKHQNIKISNEYNIRKYVIIYLIFLYTYVCIFQKKMFLKSNKNHQSLENYITKVLNILKVVLQKYLTPLKSR